MNETDFGLPLIGDADLCILSGKLNALRHALALKEEGKKVLIAVKGSCLAEDIRGTFSYRLSEEERGFFPERVRKGAFLKPDEGEKYLEALCLEAGIGLLYGVYPVDCRSAGRAGEAAGKKLLRLACKGGLFGILCGEVWEEAGREKLCAAARFEYTALAGGLPAEGELVREGEMDWEGQLIPYRLEGHGERGFLTVALPADPGCAQTVSGGGADALWYRRAWECVTALYGRLREEIPGLRLGRFAPCAAERSAGEKNRLSPARLRPFPAKSPEEAAISEEGRRPVWIETGNGLWQAKEERRFPLRSQVMAREETFDLVVAGGGTAGAMAALYAARGGAKTLLIEPENTLGGTSTAGGVSTYWFGNRFSDVREIDEVIESISSPLRLPRREGIWSERDDFHPGIRGLVLTRLCLEAGVEIRFGQLAFGTVCETGEEGKSCRGVAAAGADGVHCYYAKAVIDATGDGDLAVSAGADAVYGSERDCVTYWASLAQYTDVDQYRNNFSSMVVSGDPVDATRFILIGRRRGENLFDHGSYLSMRESRHVRGAYTVNLKDLMNFRTYPDGLYTCYSNYDPKGKLDADVICCGVLPPQVSIQIPLSALLPHDRSGRRIKGIYTAGKAISATHNLFPSIRMQPDLMHQGAVLGGLLAECLGRGIVPEEMDDGERRAFLRRLTDDPLTLPESGKGLREQIDAITPASRTHWVDVPFLYEEKEKNEILSAVMAPSEEALPLLTGRLRRETTPYDWQKSGERGEENLRIRLIGLCLWHGWTEDAAEFSDFIREELADGELPERKASVMCAQLLPDHGVMPETVYRMNLLGRCKDACILPVFERVLELLLKSERDYLDIRKGIYHYIESFAYAAEHSGRKEFIPLLRRLTELPEFGERPGNGKGGGEREIEAQAALMTERLQLLRLILCRALACMGDEAGKRGLEGLSNPGGSGSFNRIDEPGLAIRLSAQMALEEAKRGGRRGDVW